MSKVVILGAGASYGHGAKSFSQPPLMKDFLSNKWKSKVDRRYQILFDYLERIGANGDMEFICDQIESYALLAGNLMPVQSIEKFGNQFEFCDPKDFLRSYILDVIVSSTNWMFNGHSCPWHDFLARDWLQDGDTIISFNYDLIIDNSLCLLGKWNESTGYGQRIVLSDEHRNIASKNSSVTLLKPHGSINWKRGYGSPISKESPYISVNSLQASYQEFRDLPRIVPRALELFEEIGTAVTDPLKRGQLRFGAENVFKEAFPFLIAPTSVKPLSDLTLGILSETWKQIEERLLNADNITSIGFSWRDAHFNAIFRSAISRQRNKVGLSYVGDQNILKNIEIALGLIKNLYIDNTRCFLTFESFIDHFMHLKI